MEPITAGVAFVWGLRILLGYLTYSEAVEILKEVQDAPEKLKRAIEEAKKKLPEFVQEIQDEIGGKIDKTELMLLHRLEDMEVKAQNRVTVPRQGDITDKIIIAAIKQEIPFRKVIGKVCALADKMPELNLRRKKNAKINPKDLIKIRKEIAIQLFGVTMDTLKEEADIDVLEQIQDIAHLELVTLVKSKQLVASLLFEEMDDSIEWASPLKAEVCFGPQFQEPKIDPQGPKTRLLRSGMKEGGITINPFYPLPYNIKNAISADLAIPDYRRKPMEKANLFAVIEIKFPGDKIRNTSQFDRYDDLSKACAAKKTNKTTLARTNGKTVVGKGCRVALFRYPEDVKVTARDETQKDPSKPDQTHQKPTHNKRGK